MGKRMIIRGADFSLNSIGKSELINNEWYSSYCELQKTRGNNNFVLFNQSSKYWVFNDEIMSKMRGKPINKVRLVPFNFTTLNLYVINSLNETITESPADSLSFQSGNSEIELKLNNTITLQSDEYLAIDNGAYDVTTEVFEDQNFYRRVGFSDVNLYSSGKTLILIDFGYSI